MTNTRATLHDLLAARPHGTREAFLRANRLKRLCKTPGGRWHWRRVATVTLRGLR